MSVCFNWWKPLVALFVCISCCLRLRYIVSVYMHFRPLCASKCVRCIHICVKLNRVYVCELNKACAKNTLSVARLWKPSPPQSSPQTLHINELPPHRWLPPTQSNSTTQHTTWTTARPTLTVLYLYICIHTWLDDDSACDSIKDDGPWWCDTQEQSIEYKPGYVQLIRQIVLLLLLKAGECIAHAVKWFVDTVRVCIYRQ